MLALELLTTTTRSSIFGTKFQTLVERNDGKLYQLLSELIQIKLGRVDVEQSWVKPAIISLTSLWFRRSVGGGGSEIQ